MKRASQRGRSVLLIPLIIALSSLLGGYFGPSLEGAAEPAADDIKASVSTFTRVLSVVEQNYADQLNHERALYSGAIPGMLRTLDPHSSFLDAR